MTKKTFPTIFDAAREGTVEDVKYFIEEQGIEVNAKNDVEFLGDAKNLEYGNTPLHEAALENTNIDVLKYLISQGADIYAKNADGYTPLHDAAVSNRNAGVAKYLITEGADIHAKSNIGWTPLHSATFGGNIEVVKLLVDSGAIVDAKDNDGNTPLDLAKREGNTAVVEYLTTAVPQRTDIKIEPPSASVKERLYKEQNGLCNACGTHFDLWNLEIDHIIPKTNGGGDYNENYQLLCGSCNRIKGDRPME